MSSELPSLTGKQELFITWYVKLLNATRAAQRAGYEGDLATLSQVGYENLNKPEIRTEIDRRLRESIPTSDEVLSMITRDAVMDVTPYAREDGTLDVQRMGQDGLGHLIRGIKPGREGPEVTLIDPQAARKMLARYHKLLSHLDVDVHTDASLDAATLDALTQQIAIAQRSATEQDATEDVE